MKKISFVVIALMSVVTISLVSSCGGGKDKKNNADSNKVAKKPMPGDIIKYDSSKRYIFLTFDDAPQPPGTTVCRDIFRKNGVKATFFVVGMHQFDQNRKRIVEDLNNSYPEFLIANHSHSHGFQNKYKSFYAQPDSAVKDFQRAEQEMNIPVKIIRLPGNTAWVGKGELKGPKSTLAVCKRLDSLGYNVIGWDIEWQFKGGGVPIQSAEQMIKEVTQKLDDGYTNEPNCIVLLAHDRMFAKQPYSDSLNKFIAALKQDSRNVFETIDHYPLVQRTVAK